MKVFFKLFVTVLFFNFLAVLSSSSKVFAENHSTHIVIDSQDLQPFSDGEPRDKEERFAFYRDEKVSVDLNDDGDPNLNMQF